MERMFSAVLTSPAKIDDELKGPGGTVVVSQGILLQLVDAKLVDWLSVTLFDPDAESAEDTLFSNAALIEAEVSARVATIRAAADQRVAKAEADANDRVALIEAAATARIAKAEEEAAAKIAAAATPPDLIKPGVKPKPK